MKKILALAFVAMMSIGAMARWIRSRALYTPPVKPWKAKGITYQTTLNQEDREFRGFVDKIVGCALSIIVNYNMVKGDHTYAHLKVHHEEKAVVGTYSYDIAKSKVEKAMEKARTQKFPLKLTYMPE